METNRSPGSIPAAAAALFGWTRATTGSAIIRPFRKNIAEKTTMAAVAIGPAATVAARLQTEAPGREWAFSSSLGGHLVEAGSACGILVTKELDISTERHR